MPPPTSARISRRSSHPRSGDNGRRQLPYRLDGMISTRDLSALPDVRGFRRLTRSLAMLDAIMSPEWEFRYYSFDSRWAPSEMMASMRNGHGDHWFALIGPAGIALHGLAHEAPTFRPGAPQPGIFNALPREFQKSFLNEPAFDTANSTFCIWRRTDDNRWWTGAVEPSPVEDPDGSAELLSMLAGDPRQYVDWAADYYERTLNVLDVSAVYRHSPLTPALAKRLNPAIDFEELGGDIDEIGYPEAPDA